MKFLTIVSQITIKKFCSCFVKNNFELVSDKELYPHIKTELINQRILPHLNKIL